MEEPAPSADDADQPVARLVLPPGRLDPGDEIRLVGEGFEIHARVDHATGVVPLTGDAGRPLRLRTLIQAPPAVAWRPSADRSAPWTVEPGEHPSMRRIPPQDQARGRA